jgi:hypothetical protein
MVLPARNSRENEAGYAATPSAVTAMIARPGCHCALQCDSSLLLQHRQAVSEGYSAKMSKPSCFQLIVLLIPTALLAAYLGIGSLAPRFDLELPLWLQVWCAAYIASILHVATTGLVGTFLDVQIERMSFGFGKRWLEINIAAVPISFGFPFGGSVKFVGDEPNVNPKLLGWRRCGIELSGCTVLLVFAAVILGRQATFDVLGLWRKLIEGALSPFSHAQVLLIDLGRYLDGLNDVSIFAVVSFGLAAWNLLPLPLLNGGNALMFFVSSTLYPLTRRAQECLFRAGLLTFLFVSGSWLLALLFLAYKSWRTTLLG